jgi:cysteine desulfurase
VWCGSATEALATAIFGLRLPHRIVVTTGIEHVAVLRCCDALEAHTMVRRLPPDGSGVVNPADFAREIATGSVGLVVMCAANGETGAIQPYRAIAAMCEEHEIPFVLDAAQIPGRLPIDLGTLRPTAAILSPHKWGGIKGVGVLWLRAGARPVPLYRGGKQQAGSRPGTEPVPAIVAAGAAAEQQVSAMPALVRDMTRARAILEERLVREAGASVWSANVPRLPNTACLWVHAPARAVVRNLDRSGIAVASGAACGLGAAPSHVIRAMAGDRAARETIRISTGWQTSERTAHFAAKEIVRVVQSLRTISA